MNTNDLTGEIGFLARELKTPVIAETFTDLGDRARAEGWSHEQYLAAVLGRQVASRTANGTRLRISAAHLPAVKTIEDFVFDHIPAASRDLIAHLATCTFIPKRENVVLLGPPGTGKTHLAIALSIKAAEAAHPVLFDSATGWINRLATAHTAGALEPDFHRCACFVNVCACQELSAGGFGALTGGENRACEPASAESKEAGRVRPQRRPRRKGTACG